MKSITGLVLKYEVVQFSSLVLAKSYTAHSVKAAWIVLGDNDKYWIVCPADFEKLIRAGYQAAK